jgi:lysophospholipase L1-like esterase
MQKLYALMILVLAACATAPPDPVVIALVGDSTVTDKSGWGAAFAAAIGDHATVVNLAAGGRSAKSFLDEGRLQAVLDARPDYVFIQFGHNGQPGKGAYRETDPDSTYREFLVTYIEAFRAIGAEPIIVSSVTRRRFDDTGHIRTTLSPWAGAARDVAAENGVAFVDLHSRSIELHNRIGLEASMAFNPEPDDVTHFNATGAAEIAALVIGELHRLQHPLASVAPDQTL